MLGLYASLDPALRRTQPVFALVAVVTLLSCAIAAGFGEGATARVFPFALIGTVAPGLWLIARGYRWARWLLTYGFGALAIVCAGAALFMLLLDATVPQEPRSLIATRMTIIAALLFSSAAGVLFASDALDELCTARTRSPGLITWDSVSARPAALSSPRKLPDPALASVLRRRGAAAAWLSTVAATLAWVLFLAAAVWLWSKGIEDLENATRAQSTGSPFAPLIVIAYVSTAVGYVGYLALAFVGFFAGALVILLPVALPPALKWKNPVRFLILRPFHRAQISRTLRRIVRRELAPLGHCYTLADADIRVPLWVRLPVALGQLSFFMFRQRRIAAPGDLAKLARAMDWRVLRNFNWCVSVNKVFPVASTEAGWRACVTRFVAECDGVVMDLSGISENILWELDLLERVGALNRTVFVVQAEQRLAVQATLDRLLGAAHARKILAYSSEGMIEGDSLTASVENQLKSFRMKRNT